MSSPLSMLCGPNMPLTNEPWDQQEFRGLVKSGTARLMDAKQTNLSPEGRFDLAYNAAHALSLAALRNAGYRPNNRYIVFQVLPQTLGLSPQVWRVLAKCHDTRNLGEYEGPLEYRRQAGTRPHRSHATRARSPVPAATGHPMKLIADTYPIRTGVIE